jgi:hypothetical protein
MRQMPRGTRGNAGPQRPNGVAVAWFAPYRRAWFRRRSGVLVAAARDDAIPDRERAETYLRLLAEGELRRALAMPQYKPPREFRSQRAVQTRLMRRRRAILDRFVRQDVLAATASSRSGHAIQLRRFRRTHRHRGYQSPPAEDCLTRMVAVAGAFAAVGAVTAETEKDVVDGLRAALAARSRIEQDALLGYHTFGGVAVMSYSGPGGHPMRRIAGGTAAPAGPPRVIPVGASASGEIEGVPVRFYFGVLVIDHSGATLTVHARFPAELEEPDDGRIDSVYDALNELSAVDDRGATYRADFSGGGGVGQWDGRLRLSPAPPPGVGWLDMTLPGTPSCRLRLDAPPRDLQVITKPATTGAADHFLDDETMQLLCSEPADLRWVSDGDCDQPPLFQIAGHFIAAGVLGTDSPSVRRLVGATARLGAQLPESLAGIEPTDLPADWLSTLSRADCTDGPTGGISIAVALPEVDGVQCVLGELVSTPESATMHVHARGSARREQMWWSARDDAGGRYIVGEGGWSSDDDEANLDFEISPAINPQARVLDIMLTGTTTQVTVSVPLDWREGL